MSDDEIKARLWLAPVLVAVVIATALVAMRVSTAVGGVYGFVWGVAACVAGTYVIQRVMRA